MGEEIPNHLTADFRMAIGFLVFCDIWISRIQVIFFYGFDRNLSGYVIQKMKLTCDNTAERYILLRPFFTASLRQERR